MLFVTFHGCKPKPGDPDTGAKPTNEVFAYGKDGKLLSTSVLQPADGVVLSELRGIHQAGHYLYVVVANKTQNSVLCYTGSDTKYAFVREFASEKTCAGIVHPFDVTFDDAGFCYVSSQDTNVVSRLHVMDGGKRAVPAPLAPALPAGGKFAAGTFVASSRSLQPPSTVVPQPQGLDYDDSSKKTHSVRGIVWANGALYVADQPAACIKVYDKNGKFLGKSDDAGTPVHLVVHNGTLFVTGDNHVRMAELPNPPGNFQLKKIDSIDVPNSGAMAFSNEGNLYLASRTDRFIRKFDTHFHKMNFKVELPDDPEFLLHV
jgi:hypothetical protein